MSNISTITSAHVKKLAHSIDEIRSRALDNIVFKYELGFGCDCDAVKKELILKLFNWFSFESIPQPDKVLDLLLRLVKTDDKSYLNAFGKLRFQKELDEIRKKLDLAWHEKLNEIEVAVDNTDRYGESSTNEENTKERSASKVLRGKRNIYGSSYTYDKHKSDNYIMDHHNIEHSTLPHSATLENTIPFDLTLECGDGTPVSKTTEGGIKWLMMPWQSLVTSDRGVLAAVEEALNNNTDINLILHTCQFITNVMMQDFPAEVFLQRPAIVMILHTILETSVNTSEGSIQSVVPMVLKTLHKLTRSLRFRIYYYCEPCIANKKQKMLGRKLSSSAYQSLDARDSPDGGLPEANYQAYQSTGTSDRSQSVTDNVEDSILQLQQMLIPTYCIESLKHTIAQLSIPVNPSFPLRDIKYITDLAYELVQLLIISIMPNIWLCNDDMALKINEDLKALFDMLGEVIEYFESYSSVDHFRITYLHLVSIAVKLLSNIVPLEIADLMLSKSLKMSICNAIMDAPIYLMYPKLHSMLQEYARKFKGANETACVKTLDETRIIAKSMQAAILLIKNSSELSPSDVLNTLNAAKLSLSYHKNFVIIRKSVYFLQHLHKYSLNNEDRALATKLILSLLANGDMDIQHTMYKECHAMVKNILGVEFNREQLSWENLIFLLEPSVLSEIISHGATNENDAVREMSEDILIYILKGRVQMGETGWLKTLDALIPNLQLLQCHAHPSTALGQCITKMFDPDICSSIQLSYLEVLKGNLRFLYAVDSDIREEAVCRLIWLLENEKDSTQKLPQLSSLHGLPLSSLCIFERQTVFKKSEGNYQRSNLLSVFEMLHEPNVDPKIRKSALVQISVMLTDASLHKLFITENGLSMILDIFNGALIEKDYVNYPDSAIPILTILKLLASSDCSVRHELSSRIDVLLNIIRSLFLFPNNECVKMDASQLLCLLLYNEYIMRVNEKTSENHQLNISLPYIIVTRMRLPFICKYHWKTSMYRRSDVSILHSTDPSSLTFVRIFWTWEWNDGVNVLWKSWRELNNPEISQKLMIQESDFACLQYSFPHYCCQQQLYNVQNSITHDRVFCALDYLTMYLKFYKMLHYEEIKDITLLPWEQTFERFLLSHPASKEDCDLFVDVLNFLQLYVNITRNGKSGWINKSIKNMTKSLADLFQNLEIDNKDVHQSILKLARTCSEVEKSRTSHEEKKDTWIRFIELVVSTLCLGDQQHFYNLAYLDWLLTCLTYLIGQCQWENHKNLLVSLGNTLIELIISFHGAGTVSFMGLSITRNSIICLNHLLHQMLLNFNKNAWTVFWYKSDRSLNWLPMLWQNRDPLVRASALQLLAGLMNASQSAMQLLNTIAVAPSNLCFTLLQYITNREESCIVREQACIAFSNLLKNCNSVAFQYVDSLKPSTVLIYVEQSNTYYEISVLCSNIYIQSTLDSEENDSPQTDSGKALSIRSAQSGCTSLVPRTISYLYNCQDELQPFSAKGSEITDMDNYQQLIATPSLITAACLLLNNLIFIGQQEVVRQIHEHLVDKHLFGCFGKVPKGNEGKKNLSHYSDTLEMYISICTVLTNCIAQSNEYASVVSFSPDSLYTMLCFLNADLYTVHTSDMTYLRDRLWTEIFNFVAVLSLTEGEHFEPLQTALELCGPDTLLVAICAAMKDSEPALRMSAISCLAFLLSQEIQKEGVRRGKATLQSVIDTCLVRNIGDGKNNNLREVLSSVNKLSIRNASAFSRKSNEKEEDSTMNAKSPGQEQVTIGEELCSVLLHLFIAHNYTRSKKNRKLAEDKDLIIGALTNLLCISKRAKKLALEENLAETVLMILKELYVRLNLQPFEFYRNQSERDKKSHPLLHDINGILVLLMNFMYGSVQVKETLTKNGLADVLHKLWAWIVLSKTTSTSALKLLATYTTKCPEAAQSLTLTTILPGAGLTVRRTRNTVALIHVIVQLIIKEIERAGQIFDNQKLHFAFHVLRNVVHVYECRVSISKSNLLQFFSKIHPITTKRAKPWPLVELYCLEFLIDFTYYEEGQICVPKAVDGLDVLLQLAKCSSSSSRMLAISILRNLAFNMTNRPRLLSSVDFINLLHDIFKTGSVNEIKVAGSMLWSLISNNQKGKLIARSAGFSRSLQEALGRLTLLIIEDKKQEQELVTMLQYVIRILSPIEVKNGSI
ncbi:hypothetical protein KM043_015257 [Ampulex compressa]|nr:hypothetical protein KM043_015257 [Ampulex compressa]